MPGRLFVPEIGRFRSLCDHHLLIPLDAPERALIVVSQTDGMSEFVGSSAAVEETKIHCRLVQRNIATVSTDIRPGAIVGIEGYPYFGVGSVVEIEFEIGNLLPPARLLT